jgi:Family of unknown function (DUF5995)
MSTSTPLGVTPAPRTAPRTGPVSESSSSPGTSSSSGSSDVGAAQAVGGVADRLRQLVAGLPPQDGVAVFGGVYLTVTEAVRTQLATGDVFRTPVDTARLDVLFAGRFLDALRPGPAAAPACWRPLLRLRLHPGIRPVQFALAGMNAHIEHDLPLAVLDTCRQLDCPPTELSADFHRVNEVLAQVEARVRARLLPSLAGLEQQLDLGDPLLHLVSSWSIDRARDAAWATALTLWELRGDPALQATATRALDDATGLVSRCLLTPLGGG